MAASPVLPVERVERGLALGGGRPGVRPEAQVHRPPVVADLLLGQGRAPGRRSRAAPSPKGGWALVSSLPSAALWQLLSLSIRWMWLIRPESCAISSSWPPGRVSGLPSCRAPTTDTIWPWQVS